VRRSSPQVDLLAYLRAFVLLARNPQIALAPLAAALAELLLEKLVPTEGSGMIGALNGGLMGLIIQLVDFYALAVALIVAEAVWRRGRAPFDAAWEEARSKAGAILFAAIGFGFVLYVAGLVGGIAGGLGSIALTLVATFFFIYALPAAAIGGIPGSGALQKFRELGGPALLVPAEYEGKGATLLDAVRIQRAVGSRSPSLAVATTMHHFSVASLVELTAAGNGFEWAMLMAIAENSWLLSSGFAEGKPGQHILTPTMRARPADGGITVSGVKKPCSLTWSMNLMSASVAVADPAIGTDRMAVVLIPADSAGIERAPFWQTTVLAGAESDQVTLTASHQPALRMARC